MLSTRSLVEGRPKWMSNMRQRSLRTFDRKLMAEWFAVNMPDIDFQDIYYYLRPATEQVSEWDDLPEQMKATYEKLGIPEAERKYLAGVTAQYESEVVFHRNREDLERQGVIFCDMDTALREHPELVKQYFGTVIPKNDNKFSALNTPCGRAVVRLCRRASTAKCRCRRTSASTARTPPVHAR